MNYPQLISSEATAAHQSRSHFVATVALTVLESSPTLRSLFSVQGIAEQLQRILEQPIPTKPRFSFNSFQPDFETEFLHECHIQRKVVSCPDNDEHVVFLAALKVLEKEQQLQQYSQVLKELLKKNLHKLH